MKNFWRDVKTAIREFLYPEPLEQPDTTAPEAIARWVGSHRWPKEDS